MNRSTNIRLQSYRISRQDRELLAGQNAKIVWFTGLSGSGKSTLADHLEQELHKRGVHTMLLDGDNIRHGLNSNVDFSEEGRQENIRRIGEVARLFADAGIVVLTAFISPFRNDRLKVRNLVGEGDFIEVYVECPLETCEERDVKGLYQKARAGEIKDFTGISSPFEVPENPELTIHTGQYELAACIQQLTDYLLPKIKSNKK